MYQLYKFPIDIEKINIQLLFIRIFLTVPYKFPFAVATNDPTRRPRLNLNPNSIRETNQYEIPRVSILIRLQILVPCHNK
jgi:hypothetical protein